MGKSKRGKRKQKEEGDGSKSRKALHQERFIDQVHNEVSNKPYLLRRCRDEDAMSLNMTFLHTCPEDYKRLSHGRVVVADKATNKIVLVVCFTPFEEMTEVVYEEFEGVTTMLTEISCGVSDVTRNGAHQGRGGFMKAIGRRIGYKRRPNFFSRYQPTPALQRSEEGLEKFVDDQALVSKIARVYKTRFNMLTPTLFVRVSLEAELVGVPDFEQTEYIDFEQIEDAFANNLTYSFYDFFNRVHCYNDYNSYAYEIFAPVHSNTSNLASLSAGFDCRGGEFVVPSYGVCIDFGACDGVVELIWRGKSDLHCIVPSMTAPRFSRLGTSVQISQHLVFAVQRVVEDFEGGEDMDTINSRITRLETTMKTRLDHLNMDT